MRGEKNDSTGRPGPTRRRVLQSGAAVGALTVAGCLGSDTDDDDGKSAAFHGPDDAVDADVVIYWFWGDGCPYCAEQRPSLERLAERDGVEVVALETWENPDNQDRYEEFADAYGIGRDAVPVTFVGDDYWIGYTDEIDAEIEAAVEDCLESGCPNPADRV